MPLKLLSITTRYVATQLTGLLDALYGFLPAEVAEPSGMPLSHAVLRVMARQEVGVGVLEMVEDALAHLLLEAPGKAANMKTRGKDPQSWHVSEWQTDRDCSKRASIFDQYNYWRSKTWTIKMSPAAFDTGVCIRGWTAPIKLNCRSDADIGNCLSGADADSFGKVLYKYLGIIQQDLHNLGFKFSVTQPCLIPPPPASQIVEMVVTISLDTDVQVQEQLILGCYSTF